MSKRPRPPSPSGASKRLNTGPPNAKAPKDILYDRCIAAKPIGAEFTDQELLAFGVTTDPLELIELCNQLAKYNLISSKSQTQHGVIYRTRSKATALELVKCCYESADISARGDLTNEEMNRLAKSTQELVMIYDCVETFNVSGIWKRNIVARSGLHENVVTKGLKKLISRGLVKEINSAKAVAKRIYMLSHLQPDEENTGGRFFTEGELDMGMVDGLSRYVMMEIQKRSWAEQPGPATSKKDSKGKKRKATDAGDEAGAETERPPYRVPKGSSGRHLIPQPPGFTGYPTVADVAKFIEDGGILKDVTLTKADVKQLLTKLEYDGKLERMKMANQIIGYRTVRQFWDRPDRGRDWYGPLNAEPHGYGPGSDFSQAPCGRCPVFNSCTPGGAVSPETCKYMDEWLSW